MVFKLNHVNKLNSRSCKTLCLFSSAVLGLMYYQYKKYQNKKNKEALQKWHNILEIYYPNCHEIIKKIYEAAGLNPLIIKALYHALDHEVLCRANEVIQLILSKPNTRFLPIESLANRLKAGYQKMQLSEAPLINIPTLKTLLSKKWSLENELLDDRLDPHAIQPIIDIRSKLNLSISTHLETNIPANEVQIVKRLGYLAEDLNMIHTLFGKRIFKKLPHLELIVELIIDGVPSDSKNSAHFKTPSGKNLI